MPSIFAFNFDLRYYNEVPYELTKAVYWDMELTVTPSGSSVVGTWQLLPSTACNAFWTLVC